MISRLNISEILGHKENTLLFKYCDKEINGYDEPERRGVHKGDRIGSSFMRNAAAVLVGLTNIQMKILAETSQMSYSSMRTWNTQEDFKNEKERRCQEFIDFVKEEIKKGFNTGDIQDEYLYSECVEENLPKVLIIGKGKLRSSLGVSGWGTVMPTKNALIKEIERHTHILSKGVVSRKEKDSLLNLLSMVKSYVGAVKD